MVLVSLYSYQKPRLRTWVPVNGPVDENDHILISRFFCSFGFIPRSVDEQENSPQVYVGLFEPLKVTLVKDVLFLRDCN